MRELPRGTVTFLLTEVVGSTRRWEDDPDAMAAAVARSDLLVAEIVARHGGVLVKPRGEGDSYFIVFDRASDAVAAALDLAPLLELPTRMAIHTGEVELRDGDYYGPPVNRCARLRATAHAGQIVVSGTSAQRTEQELPADASLLPLGLHYLKDLTQPEPAYQLSHPSLAAEFPPLQSAPAPAQPLPLPLDSFLGRASLVDQLLESMRTRPGRVLALTGVPGVGKSRVLLEVVARWFAERPAAAVEMSSLGDDTSVITTPGLLALDDIDRVLHRGHELVRAFRSDEPTGVVLTTSRRSAGFPDEETLIIDPLDPVDATQLFRDRALAAAPTRVFDETGLATVAAICERLDRLPLGIELAAARSAVLGLDDLLARLDQPLRVLGGRRTHSPAHHRSMREALAWTIDDLPAEVRAAAGRHVAAGGTLQDASDELRTALVEAGLARRDGDTWRLPAVVAAYLTET